MFSKYVTRLGYVGLLFLGFLVFQLSLHGSGSYSLPRLPGAPAPPSRLRFVFLGFLVLQLSLHGSGSYSSACWCSSSPFTVQVRIPRLPGAHGLLKKFDFAFFSLQGVYFVNNQVN